MVLDNQKYSPDSLRDVFNSRVAIVHQESALILSLSVAENMLSRVFFSRFKIPSFILTLGIIAIARGVVLLLTQGKPIMATEPFVR